MVPSPGRPASLSRAACRPAAQSGRLARPLDFDAEAGLETAGSTPAATRRLTVSSSCVTSSRVRSKPARAPTRRPPPRSARRRRSGPPTTPGEAPPRPARPARRRAAVTTPAEHVEGLCDDGVVVRCPHARVGADAKKHPGGGSGSESAAGEAGRLHSKLRRLHGRAACPGDAESFGKGERLLRRSGCRGQQCHEEIREYGQGVLLLRRGRGGRGRGDGRLTQQERRSAGGPVARGSVRLVLRDVDGHHRGLT